MRVVGGIWKGRSLDAPDGRETRPTSDRVRESIASALLSAFDLSLDGVRVLDAFAGSGAFGIEMLSRGAASCTFVDSSRAAVRTIRRNLASLGAQPSSFEVIGADILKAADVLQREGRRFDVVFLDPPYAMPARDVGAFVEKLCSDGLVSSGSLIVYERAAASAALDTPSAALLRSKKLGETAVDYHQIGVPDEDRAR